MQFVQKTPSEDTTGELNKDCFLDHWDFTVDKIVSKRERHKNCQTRYQVYFAYQRVGGLVAFGPFSYRLTARHWETSE